MTSLSNPGTHGRSNSHKLLIPLSTTRSKKKKTRKRSQHTIQAPVEVISFFYRLGREAREQRQSFGKSNLPDDLEIPPVLYQLSSTCSTIDFGDCDSVVSWYSDDREIPEPVMLQGTRSEFRFEQSSLDEKRDWSEVNYKNLSDVKFQRKPKKQRANSLDFAYSEANEASRIRVALLTSPKAIENILLDEKQEDSTILKAVKEQLEKGRRRIIYSKPILNRREVRYERQKDHFAKIYLKKNRLRKNRLIRAKTSRRDNIHHRAKSKQIFLPCALEKLMDADVCLYDDLSMGEYKQTQ